MSHRHGVRMRYGTTVLELVVALLITAVVGAIGASAFQQASDRRDAVLRATVETERASALRATVRRWLSGATVGTPVLADSGIVFVTSARTPAGTAGATGWLYVDTDPDTPARGLSLAVQSTPDAPVDRRELDASITAMRVEYLERTTRRWRERIPGVNPRPLAVRLSFVPRNAAGQPLADDATARLWALPLTVVLTDSAANAGGTP